MEKIYDEFLRRCTTPTSNKRELCPYIHVYTICILQHRRVNKMTHGGGVLTGALNWFSNILFSEL